MDEKNSTEDILQSLLGNFSLNNYTYTGDDTGDGGPQSNSDTSDIYFLVGMLSVFSVVGTIGNALIIYIFSQMLKHKLTSTIFILTLGVTDFFTCLITIPCTILIEYYKNKTVYDIPCKLYTFLMTTTVPYSSFIMVAIGVDRYLCICRPFLHAMNIRRAKIIVFSMAGVLVPFGTIIALFYGVYKTGDVQITDCPDNITFLWKQYNNTSKWAVIEGTWIYKNDTGFYCNRTINEVEYTGVCRSNTLIFPRYFFRAFQFIHSSFFVIAIVSVFILYGAILKRVLEQNKSRGGFHLFENCCKKKSKNETGLSPSNGDAISTIGQCLNNGEQLQSLRLKTRRGSKKGDKMLMANLKIAGTLFTVAMVFGLAFLPAWLMALWLIDFNIRLFYSYFVYNIANPVIYAFLNPSFREQLKQLLPCLKKKPKTRSSSTLKTANETL